MSGGTTYEATRKHHVAQMRAHDYLYDSAFIVSGARDYARMAFRAAMASAQMIIQPNYDTMFSELRKFPRANIVYHPNCRLPKHMDRSYSGYVARARAAGDGPPPQLTGKDRFKYAAYPKKLLPVNSISPDFHPPSPVIDMGPTRPRNRGTQSMFRESSAQTQPWQPDGKAAENCDVTPEVLYLDKLEWGPGQPFRTGDLPADFHTTEIINKMRHARTWTELVEKGSFPRWMKKADAVIGDVETKDWIFREAEIDELQEIRLELLHRLQAQQRQQQNSRSCRKLAKLWDAKKQEMEKKVHHIRHTRDRELRKLAALHGGGGRVGQVARMRAARGHGSATHAARNPTSDVYAPLARHGYQARRRHAVICYDPALLSLEDHLQVAEPPAWLRSCSRDLRRSCSGHHLPRDQTQLCERETKWSEEFLEQLHNDLKKARLGAATSVTAGPLRVLKPRRRPESERPATPEVEAVDDNDETYHQAALMIQRLLRGRAVQSLMYEGRTRAGELTEELKTTHGLQKEDRARIAKEEAKAREFTAIRTEAEQKEDAISALVDELCGGAVSAALDFLEKELRRLKEERRQHAFILIALREKTMREAAEAGRRQKEIHRLREHDEMFKHVLGVTQETVDEYLREIVKEAVDISAEQDAVRLALANADRIDQQYNMQSSLSTAEQHETVAELVNQFLLPEAHKQASHLRVKAMQEARAQAAREAIFGILDDAEIYDADKRCVQCGETLGESCPCTVCPVGDNEPVTTDARMDPRWKFTRTRPRSPERTISERFPPHVDFRCMLNTLLDEAVQTSRAQRHERESVRRDAKRLVEERFEMSIDARQMLDYLVDRAMGLTVFQDPVKKSSYQHLSRRVIGDALERSVPFETPPCPRELPSEIRRRAEEEQAAQDTTCKCNDEDEENTGKKKKFTFGIESMTSTQRLKLLPSEIRQLEEMRRCKCDTDDSSSPQSKQVDEPVAAPPTETEYTTETETAGSELAEIAEDNEADEED